MSASEECANVTSPVETYRFVVGNAVTKLADMSKVFIDIGLVFALMLVGKNLQESLATTFIIPLCKKESPKPHSK